MTPLLPLYTTRESRTPDNHHDYNYDHDDHDDCDFDHEDHDEDDDYDDNLVIDDIESEDADGVDILLVATGAETPVVTKS